LFFKVFPVWVEIMQGSFCEKFWLWWRTDSGCGKIGKRCVGSLSEG